MSVTRIGLIGLLIAVATGCGAPPAAPTPPPPTAQVVEVVTLPPAERATFTPPPLPSDTPTFTPPPQPSPTPSATPAPSTPIPAAPPTATAAPPTNTPDTRPPAATLENDSATVQVTLAQLNAAVQAAFRPDAITAQPPIVTAGTIPDQLQVRVIVLGSPDALLTLSVGTVQTTSAGGMLELRAIALSGIAFDRTIAVKRAQALVQAALDSLVRQAINAQPATIEYLGAGQSRGIITVNIRLR